MRPRSGLAAKHGVTVLNSPGTVDADYRGEINVLLINHGDTPFPIRRGERIAQMVIAPVVQAQLVPRDVAVGNRSRQRRFRLDRALNRLNVRIAIQFTPQFSRQFAFTVWTLTGDSRRDIRRFAVWSAISKSWVRARSFRLWRMISSPNRSHFGGSCAG